MMTKSYGMSYLKEFLIVFLHYNKNSPVQPEAPYTGEAYDTSDAKKRPLRTQGICRCQPTKGIRQEHNISTTVQQSISPCTEEAPSPSRFACHIPLWERLENLKYRTPGTAGGRLQKNKGCAHAYPLFFILPQ